MNIALIRREAPVLGVGGRSRPRGSCSSVMRGGGAHSCTGGFRYSDADFRPAASRGSVARTSQPLACRLGAGALRRRAGVNAPAGHLQFAEVLPDRPRGRRTCIRACGPFRNGIRPPGRPCLNARAALCSICRGRRLRYGKDSIRVPPFIACGDPAYDWLDYLP